MTAMYQERERSHHPMDKVPGELLMTGSGVRVEKGVQTDFVSGQMLRSSFANETSRRAATDYLRGRFKTWAGTRVRYMTDPHYSDCIRLVVEAR